MRCHYIVRVLLPALLLPQLAHADPWGARQTITGVVLVAAIVLLGLVGLTVALVVLAYLRPQWQGVYYAQLALLGLNALGGLALFLVAQQLEKALLGVNPFWQLSLPLGLWLNALRWARQTPAEPWRGASIALAVVALNALLYLPLSVGLNISITHLPHPSIRLLQVAFVGLSVVVLLIGWAIVSWQLRDKLPAAAWQPW